VPSEGHAPAAYRGFLECRLVGPNCWQQLGRDTCYGWTDCWSISTHNLSATVFVNI
jgi:hypothetical protein